MVEMRMYWPMWPFSTRAASRTQTGNVVGLSMQTSQSRPSSALRSPITVAEQLLYRAGPGLLLTAAVEDGDVVPAGQCIADLIWADETSAAQAPQAHWRQGCGVR